MVVWYLLKTIYSQNLWFYVCIGCVPFSPYSCGYQTTNVKNDILQICQTYAKILKYVVLFNYMGILCLYMSQQNSHNFVCDIFSETIVRFILLIMCLYRQLM